MSVESLETTVMMTPPALLGYVQAQPFRPFRARMASGGTFEVHHPEKIKLLKRSVVVFKADGDIPEIPDECESVSLMLAETVSYLEAPVC